MARNAKEEMAWKPRRLRTEDVQARVAHLQRNLPPVVQEVFGGEGPRAGVQAQGIEPESNPVKPKKKSKFAVLHWEPREP
jgi:hypothetical protein